MKTSTLPQAPEKIELEKGVAAFVESPIAISSTEQNGIVANRLALVKGEINRLGKDRKTFTKPLDDLKKAIMDRYNEAIEPLEEYEREAKKAMADWEMSERQRIAKENAKLQAEAEEAARKEREKLEKKAERAEKTGNDDKAQELRQQADNVMAAPAPIVQQQKTSGVSFRDHWEIEVTNPDLVPREYCVPDESRIGKVANAMAGKIKIPGVKITHKLIPASKSR